MSATPPGPSPRDAVRRSVVHRLLGSLDFRRSREASARIVDDPDSLRDLAETVRERGYDEGPLEPVADRIDAALNLIDDRAEQLDQARAGDPAVGPRSGASASTPAELSPARAARQRLIVAALHYLARPTDSAPHSDPHADPHGDPQPRTEPRGAVEADDVVVVSEVLGSAHADLEPYLGDDESGSGTGASAGGPARTRRADETSAPADPVGDR